MSATSIAEKFEVIADAVHKKGLEQFSKSYQNDGNRTDYSHAFRRWTKEYFEKLNLKYDITAQNAQYMFQGANIPVDLDTYLLEQFGIKLTTEGAKDANLIYAFNASNITGLGEIDASNCTSINYICLNCGSLKYIKKLKVSEKCVEYNQFVQGCTSLESIEIEGTIAATVSFSTCPLNKASIESVVSPLLKTAEGKTVTFKKSAVETAFTTDEWITLITEYSNQYDGNWTFSLV